MALKDNPIVYLTRQLWKYSVENRKKIALYASMFLGANLVDLSQPFIMAAMFNELQKNGLTENNIWYLYFVLSLLIVRGLAFWAFHGPARLIENKNAFIAGANYKKFLLGGVMFLPLEWHVNHHTGDTIDKIEKGTRGLKNYASETFRVIGLVVYMTGAVLALAFFDKTASFIALGMIAVTIWIVVTFDKVLVRQYKELNRAENKISEKIVDAITNITAVIILRIEKLILRSISAKIMEPFELYQKNSRLNELKWFIVGTNTKIMLVLVLGYYLYSNYGLPVAVGTFFALYNYTDNIGEAFYNIASLYGDILRERASAANSEELASEFIGLVDDKNGNGKLGWKKINIEALNFSYHGSDGDLHLENVALAIARGEKVALIGTTGSGKTTLLKVIRELYQPQSAKVYLDGEELPGGLSSISCQISLIQQEPEIFATTVLENVTAWVEHNMTTVLKYTDMACFTEVAERLPKKFESLINEKGVNLSGGEKQRLALARGLLASEDKTIVLLDEPTSSVDIANELAIYQNIFRAFSDKAIISSVHRLHLLPMFDRIYFFGDGKVIASGTFEELLQNSAEFQELWNQYQNMLQNSQNPA